MLETPENMLDHPDTGRHSMAIDVLSDVLRVFRLSARVYLHASFCGAWAVDVADHKKAPFHVIAQGSCWLHFPDRRAPVALGAGDLVVFPHDTPHVLADSPQPPGPQVPRNQPASGIVEGPFTTLVCGDFGIERRSWNPLLEALPEVIVARHDDTANARHLDALLRLIVAEAGSDEPGGKAVVDKLAETLFVLVVRTHLRQQRAETGYLAALVDPRVGKTLQALHEHPERKWIVEDLARVAGQSRSAFADRFQRLVGIAPLQYLTHWRMRRAHEWLATGTDSVARIAERCGYGSEAAFAKVFKRHIGIGPGAARRHALRSSAPGVRPAQDEKLLLDRQNRSRQEPL
jgi:AraC-like DNA-binding protein